MSDSAQKTRIRRVVREIEGPASVEALRHEIGARLGGTMLESVAPSGRWGRYSIYAVDPVFTVGPGGLRDEFSPLLQLEGKFENQFQFNDAPAVPFFGGWIGYLSYEAARFIEPMANLRVRPTCLHFMQWSLFDAALLHDTRDERWFVAGVDLPRGTFGSNRQPLEGRLRELEECTKFLDPGITGAAPDETLECRIVDWNYTHEEYLKKVSRILDYIRAGDIFQVNLARRLTAEIDTSPFEIYERLCRFNPATHAAYIPIVRRRNQPGPPAAIISSSPELLVSLTGREVVTRPIKGTRPRGANEAGDQRAAAELASSEKDRAELNMIIDLERNDLGRVCEFGSVHVESSGEIESLPTVFHRTATITGRLRPDLGVIDLLRAIFPGGSITGAPKVRAMQIIQELEPDPRGPYCGAIGYVGLDGNMQLNLPIRTLTMQGSHVQLHVGSGIVADSNPEDEFRELQAKSAGMLRALGLDPGQLAPDEQHCQIA